MNLYRVKFNDYGDDYIVARNWQEAGDKIAAFYTLEKYPTRIKNIELVALYSSNDKEYIPTRLHLSIFPESNKSELL